MTTGLRGLMLAGSALLLATGLGACSKSEPDDAPIENSAFDEEAPPSDEPNAEASFEPAPVNLTEISVNTAVVEELPPPPPIEPDQQMLDDASATGMTSRSTRGDTTEDVAPADDAMENRQEE